jgi:hypothetical protein
MTPNHLGRDALHDIAERKQASFLRQLRVVDDLKEQIAQLLAEILGIAPLDRIGDLVGFLDRIGRDRLKRLFDVPGAARLARLSCDRLHPSPG